MAVVQKHKDNGGYGRLNYETDNRWMLNFTTQGTGPSQHIGDNQRNVEIELRGWMILDPAYAESAGEVWIPASDVRIIIVYHKTLGGDANAPDFDFDELLETPDDIVSMWNWSTFENFDVLYDRTMTFDPYSFYVNELAETSMGWNKTTDSCHFCIKLPDLPSNYASGGTGDMTSGAIAMFILSTLNPELFLFPYRSHYWAWQSRTVFKTS